MLKKMVILSLLIVSTTQSVILKNGAAVPYDIIVRVKKALKKLKILQQYWLREAARSQDLMIYTPGLVRGEGLVGHRDYDEKVKDPAQIEKFYLLGLCDHEGKMDRNTAHVIESYVKSIGFKGRHVPIFISMQNPIHIKNYFMPSFWSDKIKNK